MMSSYHIIQAIWVGVFPMLAATVVVGILCYLLCCLNQIKIRLMQSRKRKRMREARKRALKEKQPLSQPIKVETRIVQVEETKYKPIKVEAVNVNYPQNAYKNQPLIETVENVIGAGGGVVGGPPSAPPLLSLGRPSSFKTPLPKSTVTFPNEPQGNLEMPAAQPTAATTTTTTTNTENNELKKREDVNSRKSSSEIEQLVVQELNESPKSVYSRLQTLMRLSNAANNNGRAKLPPEDKSKLESKKEVAQSSNSDFESDSFEENEETENDYDEDTNDEQDGKSSSENTGTKNKILDDRPQNRPDSKAKLVELSKNRQLSDIDIEDDLLFADDDDSLSSAGLCGTGTSAANISSTMPTSCLVSKIQRSSYKANKCLSKTAANSNISPINESDISCSKCTGLAVSGGGGGASSSVCTFLESPPPPSSSSLPLHEKRKNLSSMSDIEPDENIVKNILVKTPTSTRKKYNSDKF